jgi:hypothetical protein
VKREGIDIRHAEKQKTDRLIDCYGHI